jgi:phosphate transport system permease protein
VNLNRRKLLDHALRALTGLCAVIACSILGVIVYSIVSRGWSAISLKFFTEQIRLVGADGGIFYNLVGTGILMATAFALSAPLAISLALTYTVGLNGSRLKPHFSLLLYVLNGVPSILFGIFGMIIFVGLMGLGKSWLVGGILLGFMILPTVTVSLIERMGAIPRAQLEAAAALGLHKSQIIRSVILPQSFGGLITGSLLGLARAAGETAPIMFTATVFAGATIPAGVKESPVLSLPYHIFILAQDSFDPAVGAKLWGTALTLLFLVAILSLIALPMRLKIHQPAHHD